MRNRRLATVLAGLFPLLCFGVALAQTHAPDIRRIERFRGSVRLAGKDVPVAIDTWLIPNGTRIDALELPLRGQTVVELRGGRIFTVIDGKRLERSAGDFWAVPPSAKIRLETEHDSAALQTTVVAE